MAHLCSAYPFHADAGFGGAGRSWVSTSQAGTRVLLRPVQAVLGSVDEPNMLVVSSVGFGKSATVKALLPLRRRVWRRRYLAVIDPKGEYQPCSRPGSFSCAPDARRAVSEPMDPAAATSTAASSPAKAGSATRRRGVDRALEPVEDAVLGWAIERLCQTRRVFVARRAPRSSIHPRVWCLSRHSPLELARATAPMVRVGQAVLTALRGMFDSPPRFVWIGIPAPGS
jgi:hypothetical protein